MNSFELIYERPFDILLCLVRLVRSNQQEAFAERTKVDRGDRDCAFVNFVQQFISTWLSRALPIWALFFSLYWLSVVSNSLWLVGDAMRRSTVGDINEMITQSKQT